MDMYEAFYEDPRRFYRAVEEVLGGGAEVLMRVTLLWLIQNGYLNATERELDDFLKLLKEGREEARNIIISSFRWRFEEG